MDDSKNDSEGALLIMTLALPRPRHLAKESLWTLLSLRSAVVDPLSSLPRLVLKAAAKPPGG